jgi:hypothetical protein
MDAAKNARVMVAVAFGRSKGTKAFHLGWRREGYSMINRKKYRIVKTKKIE